MSPSESTPLGNAPPSETAFGSRKGASRPVPAHAGPPSSGEGFGSTPGAFSEGAMAAPPTVVATLASASPSLPLRRILRRFSHLLILTTLVAVPLLYPLQIAEDLDFRITRHVLDSGSEAMRWLWLEQFQPALYSGYSPLTLKRIVWAFLVLMLASTHLIWKTMPDTPNDPAGTRRLSVEYFVIVGFIVWAGLSFLVWLTPGEETGLRGGGGFQRSIDTWADMIIGVGFFLLTADLLRRRRWVFKGIGLLIGVGTIVAILAVGQRQGWTASFLTRWELSEHRNRMASLIGQNTGLSSFLMAPLLLSLALAMPRWRRLGRLTVALVGCFWLLMILTLVMAQSRAVLLILLVVVPVLLYKLHRASGLSPGRSAWILVAAVFLFTLLSQTIPSAWNPFYDHALPLTQRARDLSLDRLRAETRLRITTCSGALIAQAPLRGHGFGSFQYVYPKAQGRYFVENPETLLVPTGRRTERAHNEYLQTWIETGLVGLAIALLALGLVLRQGWQAFSRTLRPDDIPIQLGFLTVIAAILVHAFVDFPFRVPPIAATLAWCLAVWYAGDKIWLPRHGRLIWPEDDDAPVPTFAVSSETPPPGLPSVADGPHAPAAPAGRIRWLLWGASAAAILLLALFVSSWYSCRLTVDTFNVRANRLLDTHLREAERLTAPQRLELLKRGRHHARDKALRLRPLDGETHLLKAFLEYYLARECYAQALAAIGEGDTRQESLWLSDATLFAKTCLQTIELALAEIRYHQVFHLRGECFRLLAEMLQDASLHRKALESMEMAIAYTPAHPEGLIGLVRLIEDVFPQLADRRAHLLSLLYKYNPTFLYSHFVVHGTKAVEDEHYDEAARIFRDLSDAVPADDGLLGLLASAYLSAGDLEKCEAILTELAQVDPRPVLYDSLSASLAIRREQWRRALAHIKEALERPGGDLDYFRIMRLVVLEKLGEHQAAAQGFEALESKAKHTPQVYIDFANVLSSQFGGDPRAIDYLRRYLRESDRPLPPRLLSDYARHLHDNENRSGEALRLLRQALTLQPDHRPSLRLLERIRREKPEADDPTAHPPEV